MFMKRIRIILLVAFILGLVLFQVKFVAENDIFNIKADISLSQKANANPEWSNPESPTGPGLFFNNTQTTQCGTITTKTYTYSKFDDYGDLEEVGTAVWIDGVLQIPWYTGSYDRIEITNTTQAKWGWSTTCEAGNMACTPATFCP